MKKLRITHIWKTGILGVVFLFTSCTDWMTIVPENDLIKEKFWKKTEDVEGALGACYNALRAASLKSLIFGELRADLIEIGGANFSDYERIAGSDISPTNGAVSWEEYYKAINLANTLMFYDEEVFELDQTFTAELKDAIEAEARFIRSMAYFYLVRLWKDVPLVTEASISDTSNLYVPKSTEPEVIDFIIEDLLTARDLAFGTQWIDRPDYFHGRANKYSITALLADVYLWAEEYQNCINACDYIINSGLYSLEPTDTWWLVYYPGNSNENIIELQYDDNLESQENPLYYSLLPVNGGGQANLDGQAMGLITLPEDPRRQVWNLKYLAKDFQGQIGRTFSERDANWILYRYAEILLMKAEASIELGDFATANELMQETMLRAGIPFQDETDLERIREALLNERGREFVFEGKRWFDILRAAKRNGFAKKNLIIDMILSGADVKQQAVLRTRVFDTLSYFLPVPERELIYNQNLVQNPYYDR